jgi:uncharacterized membrane protein YbhN (UPF0104 family)
MITGKLAVAAVANAALSHFGGDMTFRECFRLCSVSQLGKYLPGGFWHLVGRSVAYRKAGHASDLVAKALVAENCWLLGSAFAIGLAAAGAAAIPALEQLMPLPLWGFLGRVKLLAALLLWLGIISISLLVRKGTLVKAGSRVLFISMMLAAAWMCFGLAFWCLLPAPTLQNLLLAVGAFSLGWGLGYVTPFAPAGLGIRELVISAVLVHSVSVTEASFCAASSRVLWTLCEIGLAVTLNWGWRGKNLRGTNA